MIALLALAACGEPQPTECPPPGDLGDDGAVAFVADGVPVTEGALSALIERIPRHQALGMQEDGRSTEFVEHVALSQALYRRALEAGLDDDPDIALAVAMGAREVLALEYVRWRATARVTDEAVAERHASMELFRIPQVRLRHLRLAEGQDPAPLLARLEAGESFEAVARAASADPDTAARGGDLGWIDRAAAKSMFGVEVSEAAPGAVLGPVVVEGGRHLVLVEDARAEVPLDEVRLGLRAEMLGEEMRRVTDEVRAELTIERPDGARRP